MQKSWLFNVIHCYMAEIFWKNICLLCVYLLSKVTENIGKVGEIDDICKVAHLESIRKVGKLAMRLKASALAMPAEMAMTDVIATRVRVILVLPKCMWATANTWWATYLEQQDWDFVTTRQKTIILLNFIWYSSNLLS